MPNSNCVVELNFVANNINVHDLYMIGDEISEKNRHKWSFYKSNINDTTLKIEANKKLIYIESEPNGMFDIIDENGDVSYDWFKFMVKYVPIIFDKMVIYTLSVDEASFGTSKDWYNLFIHSSKKIDSRIRKCLFENGKRTLTVSLVANGCLSEKESVVSNHTSSKKNKRRSIFSDRIPERRHSDSNLFGRNYKGKSMEKHYKKRVSESFIEHDEDTDSDFISDDESSILMDCGETERELKLYDKKEFRTWLIKNHPDKNGGDIRVFQMYKPI